MRVLFLNHNQERFGTYFRCYYLAKHLAKKGIQIIMICASGRDFDFGIRKIVISNNFTIITLPRIKYHKYFTGQLLRLILTIPIVLFYRYDVLHAFTVAQPQIGIPALLTKWIKHKPLIVDWDDLWGGGFADEHGGITAKVLSNFESFVPRFADRITYVSEFLGNRIRQLGLANISVKIPNGANIDDIKLIDKQTALKSLRLDPSYTYIISVGNTYFENGLRFMFDTIHLLQENNKKVRLIMVGVTDILPEVIKLYSQVKDNVIITGSVNFSEVLRYYSAADLLVLPMENNPIENARFPIRLGEYLASGKPIVSNATGEVKYILEKYNCGYIVSGYDSSEFAKIVENHIIAHKMKTNVKAIRSAHEISWSVMADTLMKIYKLYE
jgi:glycosyltransferase involved in cell wall biosynthesis